MEAQNKVFVFIDDECLVAEKGQFDEWCAFAETESQAQMIIHSRYSLGGRRLKLVRVIENRRKRQERREVQAPTVGTFFCEGCQKQVSNDLHGVSYQGGGSYCEFCQAKD